MDYMYSGPILVVDLESLETEEIELENDLVEHHLGGLGITTYLYEQYIEDNPLILGTGVFTGSLAPGSALGMITGKSPITQKMSHAPFTLTGGSELKCSGFSFIVLKNKASKPIYLWLHDGVAEFKEAGPLWGKDTWEATDWIRKEHASPNVQCLVIGQAGEKMTTLAQISLNYWGSGDRFGFGKVMGEKNLKAVAFRGLGEFEGESAEEYVEKSADILTQIKASPIQGKQGFKDFCASLKIENIDSWLSPLVHRYTSCFNCPYPCNTFVKYNEDPNTLRSTEVEEPGLLLTNLLDVISFKQFGLGAEETLRALEKAYRLGLEPCSSARQLLDNGKTLSDLDTLLETQIDSIAPWPIERGEAGEEEKIALFSTWPPPLPLFERFPVTDDTQKNCQLWLKRNALAYITGICPIFMLMAPEYNEENVVELINLGYGTEFSPEDLKTVVLQTTQKYLETGLLT